MRPGRGAGALDQRGVKAQAEIIIAGEVDQQAAVAPDAPLRSQHAGPQVAQAILRGALLAIVVIDLCFCHLAPTC